MSIVDGNWKTFMARATVLNAMFGVVVFGAVKLAVADPGGPTSPNGLTYSGVLRNLAGTGPLSGAVTLTFTLRRADGTSCPPVMVTTTANANGAFSALVSTTGCPSGFFNGDATNYDVNLVSPSGEAGPLTPDGGVAVTPVPYARFADQAGVNNDCPVGYTLDLAETTYTVCRRAPAVVDSDEVVKVGRGATAFWIDRYEATVCTTRDGACDTAYNRNSDNDLAMRGLPRTGEWSGRTPLLFARSWRYGASPSRWVTWFQAEELCRASGKRLPTGPEWLTAARGTGGITGDSGCWIAGTDLPRDIVMGSACHSEWGAQDMVGNVWEWTAEWYAGLVVGGGNDAQSNAWPSNYGGDGTWSITGSVTNANDFGVRNSPTPAATLRGGDWSVRALAGRFAMVLGRGPSSWNGDAGFRCVIPR